MDVSTAEQNFAQVLWRCRRGMLELDVMLENFCKQTYAQLSLPMQTLFVELLLEEDQDLYRWLVAAKPCEKTKFQDMLLVIRHMHVMKQASVVT